MKLATTSLFPKEVLHCKKMGINYLYVYQSWGNIAGIVAMNNINSTYIIKSNQSLLFKVRPIWNGM